MSSIKEEEEEEESEFTSKISSRMDKLQKVAEVKAPEAQKPTINRAQLIEASRTLGGLFEQINESENKTYTSSSCIIKSIFDHNLDEVNKMKAHRLNEAKSEVEENIRALLEPKKLSFNPTVQKKNLTIIEQEHLYDKIDVQILQMTRQQIGAFTSQINNEMRDPKLEPFINFINQNIEKRMEPAG